jgi:hypothetical protein
MACEPCGERRKAFQRQQADLAAGRIAAQHDRPRYAPGNPPGETSEALLRYMFDEPFKVRGNYTGRDYEFTPKSAVQFVDVRDLDSLMRTLRFRHLA